MTIRNIKAMKQTAARRLQRADYPPRRLILIHSGIALAVALVMAICEYVITWQIDANGGGLSGIQLRSILQTVGQVLSVVYAIAMPFWAMGLTYTTLRLARGKAAWPGSLLEGFRRKWVVLRLVLLQGLIYGALAFAAMYGSWFLYTFTPSGRAFMEAITKLLYSGISDYTQLMAAIPPQVIQQVSKVFLPILLVCLLVLMVPASYRLRLAPYLVMEKDGLGAWRAIRTSGKLTRGNCFRLFLLDLSYWWYYLIPVALAVPAYAQVLTEALQLQLPVSSAVLYLGGNLLYVVLTLCFEVVACPRVLTTYAIAYEVLSKQTQGEGGQ